MKTSLMFKLAEFYATRRQDRRAFLLGAVGVRKDGAIVHATNAPAERRTPQIHAEVRLCSKLDRDSVVFVVRIARGTGDFALSRPCPNCLRTLRNYGVSKVFYTINEFEHGVITL